jgi:hypothetical protein
VRYEGQESGDPGLAGLSNAEMYALLSELLRQVRQLLDGQWRRAGVTDLEDSLALARYELEKATGTVTTVPHEDVVRELSALDEPP